jgi:hypothetical protein
MKDKILYNEWLLIYYRREYFSEKENLMRKRIFWPILIGIALFVLYFLIWPVEVEPVAWQAPINPGYTGAFTKNERLKGLEMMDIGDVHGPEDIALDSQGRIYAASLLDINEHGGHGRLLVYDPQTGETTTLLDGLNFANGVAVGHDQSYILVNETGGCSLWPCYRSG